MFSSEKPAVEVRGFARWPQGSGWTKEAEAARAASPCTHATVRRYGNIEVSLFLCFSFAASRAGGESGLAQRLFAHIRLRSQSKVCVCVWVCVGVGKQAPHSCTDETFQPLLVLFILLFFHTQKEKRGRGVFDLTGRIDF